MTLVEIEARTAAGCPYVSIYNKLAYSWWANQSGVLTEVEKNWFSAETVARATFPICTTHSLSRDNFDCMLPFHTISTLIYISVILALVGFSTEKSKESCRLTPTQG